MLAIFPGRCSFLRKISEKVIYGEPTLDRYLIINMHIYIKIMIIFDWSYLYE